ncbi:L-threonylcarbamoyladenylate synthase [Candidatus Coxiella mudrowiae]|uniref:Sua5/YciO/YrdC/YwlC family protein n=1 Tax=Candidatus Coxiella mudrowiae TaxID=2054173 RepID=A0ABM5UUS6_9COXI|nr:L-threonylcarbamoyladenylate synthase [Candidatus Coxiella mudrowiae]AKQ33709.1 Sua5/YciO/YrdC/YwlC family protein [Candidatus Coxiella mudrowiae]
MSTIRIHPDNPQSRLIRQAVATLEGGGVIIYPTNSGYALGCGLRNKSGVDRVRRLGQLNKAHLFTLLCRDLSEIANYARIDNPTFRFLKAHTPGSYTFILLATREIPHQMLHPKRKTIGIQVPGHPIVQALLQAFQKPLMSVTLTSSQGWPFPKVVELEEKLVDQVNLIIDGGLTSIDPSTVVDLTGEMLKVICEGRGDMSEI